MLLSSSVMSRVQGSPARWLRFLSCLVLSAIVTDLALDANCDGGPAFTASTAILASSDTSAPDSCGTVCVPDCFCCSQSVTPGPAVLLPVAGPASRAAAVLPEAAPTGFRPVPYHPPLHLA
jgi:hypothetical protein